MIFHSPVDRVVGIDNAATIFGWAKHPKSFVSLGDADHLLTDRTDAEFGAATLAAWVERFG
jgi:putative redox protein